MVGKFILGFITCNIYLTANISVSGIYIYENGIDELPSGPMKNLEFADSGKTILYRGFFMGRLSGYQYIYVELVVTGGGTSNLDIGRANMLLLST